MANGAPKQVYVLMSYRLDNPSKGRSIMGVYSTSEGANHQMKVQLESKTIARLIKDKYGYEVMEYVLGE